MTSSSLVEDIFLTAAKKPTPAECAAYLDRVCQGDTKLRQRIERLLQARPKVGDFLEKPAAELAATIDSGPGADVPVSTAKTRAPEAVKDGVGSVVGPYKLQEKLGEGGMGTVWIAEQAKPVKRRVALKLIKAGMDTAQVLRRFEAERQALAMMDHTNIAKVFDGGQTASGRPFFVMELVKGVPITKYCDELHLSLRERLELFVPVCQAIQHAHQKGIIHRDIKPSNVLVCMQDGKPVPKVIDFGVAKAVHQRLTDETMYTAIGQLVGTLEYMSPEQAELSALDIDTRADVYALGVLLYELLTGSTPLDKKRLRKAAFTEVVRMIKEEEPPKPSTRLNQSKDTLAELAGKRRTQPGKLAKELRGELDWIVMKCLEKDRTRRYDTANGVARDIQRYLADEPVEACPPSSFYRLSKFLRRHKGQTIAASLILLALFAGLLGTTYGFIHASRARAEADRRLAQIERGNELLGSIFRKIDPGEIEDDQSLREMLVQRLDAAVTQLEGEGIGDPLTVAKLQNQLAESFISLNQSDKAVILMKRCLETRQRLLGPKHRDTLQALNDLGVSYTREKDQVQASRCIEEAYAGRMELLGPTHRDTLESLYNSAWTLDNQENRRALAIYERAHALNRAHLPVDDKLAILYASALGSNYCQVGESAKGLALLKETLEVSRKKYGPNNFFTIQVMKRYAHHLNSVKKHVEARALLEESLKGVKEVLGPDHSITFDVVRILGDVMISLKSFDEAVRMREETVRLARQRYGTSDFQTGRWLTYLTFAYKAAGKHDRQLETAKEALAICGKKCGPKHQDTLVCLRNLAIAHHDLGEKERGIQMMENVVATASDMLTNDAKTTIDAKYLAASLRDLTTFHIGNGTPEKAIPAYTKAVAALKTKPGPLSNDTIVIMNRLITLYEDDDERTNIPPLLEDLVKHYSEKQSPRSLGALNTISRLGAAYIAAKLPEKAITVLQPAIPIAEGVNRRDGDVTLSLLNSLGIAFSNAKRYPEAIALHQDLVNRQTAKHGIVHAATLGAQNRFAVTYLDAGQHAKAVEVANAALKASVENPNFDRSYLFVNLGNAHYHLKQYERAIANLEAGLLLRGEATGVKDSSILYSMSLLAAAYRKEAKCDKEIQIREEMLMAWWKKWRDQPEALVALHNVASAYWAANRLERSIPIHEEVMAIARKKLPENDPNRLFFQTGLAANYHAAGRAAEAIPLLEEVLRLATEKRERDYAETELMMALEKVGKWEDAERMRRSRLERARQQVDTDPLELSNAISWLGYNLRGQMKFKEAEALFRECLAIREEKQGDEWGVHSIQSLLGDVLCQLNKNNEEAEKLLLTGYAGIKAKEAKILPINRNRQVTRALENLVRFYDTNGNLKEADRWRKELERSKMPPNAKPAS